MIFGLAPLEAYYDRLVYADGKICQRAGLDYRSDNGISRAQPTPYLRRRVGFWQIGMERDVTYSDCSIGRGLTGTDCEGLAHSSR